MNIKSFDDLDITDPIMFGLVFSNKHIAKPFIEHLLGIIFLCPMDIFGRGFPVYHFENRAKEDANITLNDRTFKNFYIFKRYKEFSDPVVRAYMKYFATRNADSRETETINDQVSFYKADTLIRNRYMTFEYELHEREEKVKLEMIDAMFANPKFTDEDIASVSGIPVDEIAKRRTQRQ